MTRQKVNASPEFQKILEAIDKWKHMNENENYISFIASFAIFDKKLNVLDKDGPMLAYGPKGILQIHVDSLQEELSKMEDDTLVNW